MFETKIEQKNNFISLLRKKTQLEVNKLEILNFFAFKLCYPSLIKYLK
jgi:hypothetical protein